MRWSGVYGSAWIWSDISWPCHENEQQKWKVHANLAERIIQKWCPMPPEPISKILLARWRKENHMHYRRTTWKYTRQTRPLTVGGASQNSQYIEVIPVRTETSRKVFISFTLLHVTVLSLKLNACLLLEFLSIGEASMARDCWWGLLGMASHR